SLSSNADGDGNGQVTFGDTLTYLIGMAHIGTQAIRNVVVSASLLTPNTITCASVVTNAFCDLTGTYTVTASDESNGQIVNTGSVTSTEIPGPQTHTTGTAALPLPDALPI